jgi:hypothetical protein
MGEMKWYKEKPASSSPLGLSFSPPSQKEPLLSTLPHTLTPNPSHPHSKPHSIPHQFNLQDAIRYSDYCSHRHRRRLRCFGRPDCTRTSRKGSRRYPDGRQGYLLPRVWSR